MKRAVLVLVEGHNDHTITAFRKRIAEISVKEFEIRGLSVRTSEYEFDHPEEVTTTLGRLVKFATGYKPSDNGMQMEQNMSEASISFRKWALEQLKVIATDVWYGPKGKPVKEVPLDAV